MIVVSRLLLLRLLLLCPMKGNIEVTLSAITFHYTLNSFLPRGYAIAIYIASSSTVAAETAS